jgi:DSF synthase
MFLEIPDLSKGSSTSAGALSAVQTAHKTQSISKPGRLWPDLRQLDCMHDISNATLWSFMDYAGRPSYNLDLLAEFHQWQANIRALKAEVGDALKYVVLGSRHPVVFCLGGELAFFAECIKQRDREGLAAYGRSCIEILHTNWRSLDSKVITIGLVQGEARGGGFESLLSFDVVCAERGVKFGFPEQLFGLFPGMGALTFLVRKLGSAKAEWLIRSGRSVTAEELYDLGIVHLLAEPGEGIQTVNKYIQKNARRHSGHYQLNAASKRATPIPFQELDDIVGHWVEACMALDMHEVHVMERLVSAQEKLTANGGQSGKIESAA